MPVPEAVRTLLAFFDATDAGRARPCPRSSRPASCPGAIEMMDALAIEAAEDDGPRRATRRDAGAVLLVELDGAAGRVRRQLRAGRRRCASATAPIEVRVARDEAERER